MLEKFKEKALKMAKITGKSLSWTTLMFFCGLAQVWGLVIKQYYVDASKLDFLFLIKDGAFHFLCVAIVSGLTIDYWLDFNKDKDNLKGYHLYIFIVYPIGFIYLIVTHYSTVYFSGLKFHENDGFMMIFIGATALYSFAVKAYMFSKQIPYSENSKVV